ncbi:MAG: hypothetical protein H6R24_2078, partial [Proteobacteria bacterium]|nr:hypothetical protein [Pseudomonadota bacterium]
RDDREPRSGRADREDADDEVEAEADDEAT